MKQLVLFFVVVFTLSANAQTPFMVCKPGGYSNDDLKNFLFEEDEYGNTVLRQDTFVYNYAFHSARILNDGYLKCKIDYWITPNDLLWVIDSSEVKNLDMKSFMNSKKVGNDIEFFRDTFSGGVRVHEYLGCQVAWMKDTCANLIEYQLPKLPRVTSGIVQNKKPAPNGGKNPDTSDDVSKNTKPETTSDTFFIPGVEDPIITSPDKKPSSVQEEEWLRQQKEKQQGEKTAFDTLGFLGKGGNYISNSFNTTNNYIIPGGSQSQDDSNGQYAYDSNTGRYVLASEPILVPVNTRPLFRASVSWGSGFGWGGNSWNSGGNYYPPAQCYNGVTGLTSSSSYPVTYNVGSRQVRRGMNGQDEYGSIGSATGPSIVYGPR